MSILDRFHKHKGALPKNATYRLTQEGREKIMSGVRNESVPAWMKVLTALETQGSSADIDEIAGSSGLSKGQVEHNILVLIQKGYVQRSGGGYSATATEEVEE